MDTRSARAACGTCDSDVHPIIGREDGAVRSRAGRRHLLARRSSAATRWRKAGRARSSELRVRPASDACLLPVSSAPSRRAPGCALSCGKAGAAGRSSSSARRGRRGRWSQRGPLRPSLACGWEVLRPSRPSAPRSARLAAPLPLPPSRPAHLRAVLGGQVRCLASFDAISRLILKQELHLEPRCSRVGAAYWPELAGAGYQGGGASACLAGMSAASEPVASPCASCAVWQPHLDIAVRASAACVWPVCCSQSGCVSCARVGALCV